MVGTTCGRRDTGQRGIRGAAKDPVRSKAEALRRARTKVRRYCTENRLRFMWTFTYRGDGEHDLRKVRRDVERLLASVRASRGKAFPYLWVPELHKTEHGIHVHMGVPFYFDQALLEKLWGRGWVWCSDKKPKGAAAFLGYQIAARYLSKYLGKAFDTAEFGCHRYERAQGYEITVERTIRHDMDDGREYAEQRFGFPVVFEWSSASAEAWEGPPLVVLFFAGPAPDD